MLSLVMIALISVMFAIPSANAQRNSDFINPLPQRTPETDREALRLMRSDKLDLVLPGAMRDNNVDMWIHVTRGHDPMTMQFGKTSGYLILGRKVEIRSPLSPFLLPFDYVSNVGIFPHIGTSRFSYLGRGGS